MSEIELDHVRVNRALRAVITHVDYDIHKEYELVTEDYVDGYSELVNMFVAAYEDATNEVNS